ncbi:MAG: AEC family transporter [Sedimenticola sp.]
MDTVISISLPFFALIFVGFGAGRYRLIGDSAREGLNTFVYYFALPALLFIKVADSQVQDLLNGDFILAFYGAGLAVFLCGVILSKILFGSDIGRAGLAGMAAAYPNVGYIGLPLTIFAFGDAATLPAVIILTIDTALWIALGTLCLEAGKGGGHYGEILKNMTKGLALNPLLISIALGIAVSAMGLKLPEPVSVFCNLLGNAAPPCALFALGATLAARPVSLHHAAPIGLMASLKLIVHPIAVFIALNLVGGINDMWITVALIDAALPIASNVFVLGQRYNTYVSEISSAVLISTLISVFTLSGLLAYVM